MCSAEATRSLEKQKQRQQKRERSLHFSLRLCSPTRPLTAANAEMQRGESAVTTLFLFLFFNNKKKIENINLSFIFFEFSKFRKRAAFQCNSQHKNGGRGESERASELQQSPLNVCVRRYNTPLWWREAVAQRKHPPVQTHYREKRVAALRKLLNYISVSQVHHKKTTTASLPRNFTHILFFVTCKLFSLGFLA